MIRKTMLLVASLGFAGAALADFPLMNIVADNVIQKYQTGDSGPGLQAAACHAGAMIRW